MQFSPVAQRLPGTAQGQHSTSLLMTVFTAWMTAWKDSVGEHSAELQSALEAAAEWRARFAFSRIDAVKGPASAVAESGTMQRQHSISLLMTVFSVWRTVWKDSVDEHNAELQRAVEAAAAWRSRFPSSTKDAMKGQASAPVGPGIETGSEHKTSEPDSDSAQSTTATGYSTGSDASASSSEDERKESKVSTPKAPLCNYMRGRVSGLMAKVLRHSGSSWGLDIAADGYVSVEKLLALHQFQEMDVKVRDVEYVVEWDSTSSKQRFALKYGPHGALIRANQGHSDKAIDGGCVTRPIAAFDLPSCVIHGTYLRYIDAIITDGLRPMARHHVHLFTEENGVGRSSAEVLIYVDVARAEAAAVKFLLSDNGVVLSAGNAEGAIPPACFRRVVRVKDGALLLDASGSATTQTSETEGCVRAYVPPHRRMSLNPTQAPWNQSHQGAAASQCKQRNARKDGYAPRHRAHVKSSH